jgi:hypothetical protein
MRYKERVYAKCGLCSERNSAVRSVTMSSDLHIFNRPFYDVVGASKIDCTTPSNSGDTEVYIISNQTGLTFDIVFTANTESFTDINSSKFNYSIHKYDNNSGAFNQQPIYKSEVIDWTTFSTTSATTQTVSISNLELDGEYILKGNFKNNFATEFANVLRDTYDTNANVIGDNYGLYESDRDFYFVALKEADTPIIGTGSQTATPVGTFTVTSIDLLDTQTDIPISDEFPTYLVALNGLTLVENDDYIITAITSTTTIKLLNPAVSGDVLTMLFVNINGNNDIINKIIDVPLTIISGTTDNQGSNDVFYNTSTGKYEIYLDTIPINSDDILITLNGAILANNVDYYQSISNPKRIILEGVIMPSDIINVYYNGFTNIVGRLETPTPNISWSINTPPINDSGIFTIEVSSASTFNTLVTSGSVGYISGEINYNYTLGIPGRYGDTFYYRVKNEKRYQTLCNSIINSVTYSEVVPIKLETNVNDSY